MPVTREDSRPLGVVYTPPDVARPMTRLALAPLVEGRSSTEILALRICDPAAGAGAFLVEVVDYLAEHLLLAWQREGIATASRAPARSNEGSNLAPTWAHARRRVAQTCVVGIDIDARALALAGRAIGLDVDASDVVGLDVVARHVDDHLRVADALALDWRAAFPEVFARGGFDVVLANPPYIRQERLAGKTTLASYEVYDGVADLYVYFIELAHRLLRPGGRYCLIVPNKWMTVAYGRPLRSYLSGANSLDGIVDLSRHALFADADAFPCIVWGTIASKLVAAPESPSDRIEHVEHLDSTRSLRATHAGPTETVEDVLRRALLSEGSTTRLRWTGEPWHIDRSSDRALLDRLERSFGRLGDIIGTRWSRGVVTGLNDAFVIDRATRDALLATDLALDSHAPASATDRHAFDSHATDRHAFDSHATDRHTSDSPATDRHASKFIRPFVKGRDLRRYVATDIERWLLLVDRGTPFDALPAAIRAHLSRFRERLEPKPTTHVGAWAGRKPGSYAWHELQDPVVPLAKSRVPRLLYQDIQTAPACSFDPHGELVPDTTVWILPSSDRFLLAVLNSSLYGWYARRRFPPALNGAVRPKLAYMQTLPIATPSPDLRREIETLVDRRLASAVASRNSAVTRDSMNDLGDGNVLETATSDSLDRQIDELVARAYELSAPELDLVRADD